MEDIWATATGSSEDSPSYTGRMRHNLDAGGAYDVRLDEEIQGFMLMRGAGISLQERAVQLAATQQQIDYSEV